MNKPRVLTPGALYHVTSRIQPWNPPLDPSLTRTLLASVVERAGRKYRFRLYDWQVSGELCRFLIKPSEDESLSVIMRWIMGVFAQELNRRMRSAGHVWANRYACSVVDYPAGVDP